MKYDSKGVRDIYGGDPREVPLYTIPQTSLYLKVPVRTLRSWVKGRSYPISKGHKQKFFNPVITLSDPASSHLSFMNLVEAHVLSGMRRIENVPFYNVRKALKYLEEKFPSPHPLADQRFQTDGFNLFIEDLGKLINISKHGQIEMKEIVNKYLRRIERDPTKHLPIRLYPFLRDHLRDEEPLRVVIDPLVSFGKPVLVNTGVPTAVIAERFYAGDSTDDLALDYGIEREEIEEAVRYEAPVRKAA